MGMNICGDNRFEIIEHYKKQLVESTNIKSSPDEMAVIDNILFRFWQMGWLKEQETVRPVADGEDSYRCNNCGTVIGWDAWEPGGVEEVKDKFCPECGRPVKWDA